MLILCAVVPDLLSAAAHTFDRGRLANRSEFAYQRERSGFSAASRAVSAAVLLLFWLTGGFAFCAEIALRAAGAAGGSGLLSGIIFAALLFFLTELLSLPFSLYSAFSIEQRYGFNRRTPATFFGDILKGTLVTMAIGVPLFSLIHAFYGRFGAAGWLPAWAGYSLFSLLVTFLSPALILPLFNRFSPMEEGPLKERLKRLADKSGIRVAKIEVVDGSKRSTKANAFVAGFGGARRVALYDTFLKDRPENEVEAVVAHEFGHIAKGHVFRQIALSIILSAPVLYLMFRAVSSPLLFRAFGIPGPAGAGTTGIALVLTLVSAGFAGSPLTPAALYLSRKREREADSYASRLTGGGSSLAAALSSLEKSNGTHPDPHPLSVALHYGHPPTGRRIAALEGGDAPDP